MSHGERIRECKAVSNGKRIETSVAENPERHNYPEEHPDVFGVEVVPLQRLAPHGCSRVTHQRVEQERKQQYHQRIEFQRRYDVAVQQPMKASRAAATGTGKARKRAKGTSGKEPCFTRFENEEVGCPECYGQPNEQGGQTLIHDLIEPHETAKLTQQWLVGNAVTADHS